MTHKLVLFLLFISFYFVPFAQMKRSAYGIYKGKIDSYSIGKSDNVIQVDQINIEIQILKGQIFIFIGNQKYEGTYSILLQTKFYYLVEAKTDSKAPERLMVYKNERKILREGISPQPNAILVKMR